MTLDSARRSRGWTGISATVAIGMLVAGCSSTHSSSGPATTAAGTGSASSGPVASTGGRSVEVPAWIDATGRADVTKKLNQFFSTVRDGSVIEFRDHGRYRIDGTLFVRSRHDLTFDGRGSVFFAVTRGATKRSQWSVRDGSRITFRNMSVRGANTRGGTAAGAYVAKLAKQIGIRFEGVNGAEVDHVTVTNVYGDFVYLGLDKHEVGSRDVWIHDSTFRSNGRQGIAVTAASGVVIERNTFTNTRRSTIDLEPTGHRWVVDHVFVLDNTVGKGRLLFVASHGQGPVNDIVISGNRLAGHSLTIDVAPPKKRRRSNWIVTNNTSNAAVRSRPLRFIDIDGLVVRGNSQTVTGGGPALTLSGVCGALVSDNSFGGAAIRRVGSQCDAKLTVPRLPAIPGRPAGPASYTFLSGPNRGSGLPHWLKSIWLWVAVVVAVLIVVLVIVRRRRRRGRRPDHTYDFDDVPI